MWWLYSRCRLSNGFQIQGLAQCQAPRFVQWNSLGDLVVVSYRLKWLFLIGSKFWSLLSAFFITVSMLIWNLEHCVGYEKVASTICLWWGVYLNVHTMWYYCFSLVPCCPSSVKKEKRKRKDHPLAIGHLVMASSMVQSCFYFFLLKCLHFLFHLYGNYKFGLTGVLG